MISDPIQIEQTNYQCQQKVIVEQPKSTVDKSLFTDTPHSLANQFDFKRNFLIILRRQWATNIELTLISFAARSASGTTSGDEIVEKPKSIANNWDNDRDNPHHPSRRLTLDSMTFVAATWLMKVMPQSTVLVQQEAKRSRFHLVRFTPCQHFCRILTFQFNSLQENRATIGWWRCWHFQC